MGKVISRGDRTGFYAKGGSDKMYGKGTAHEAIAGVSGKEANSGAGGKAATRIGPSKSAYTEGVKMADGGSQQMFTKGHAGKKVPGVSGKATQEG